MQTILCGEILNKATIFNILHHDMYPYVESKILL